MSGKRVEREGLRKGRFGVRVQEMGGQGRLGKGVKVKGDGGLGKERVDGGKGLGLRFLNG